ncbi:MAG: alpha-amylase family glycosyl hydrolase [Planctomycetota bacterium]
MTTPVNNPKPTLRSAWSVAWKTCCWAVIAAGLWFVAGVSGARAEDVSAAPYLQVFDARWDTVEDRMADIFVAGYGRLWLPPPARADSGGQSVGYDVYDRFDLGSPRNETAYGTEVGLKTLVDEAHTAGIRVNTDFIANHNGFSDSSTFDNFGTPDDPSDDVSFVEAGGYPGFVLTLPDQVDGDFHSAFESGEQTFRLAGLIDINQSTNNQFIRSPVSAGDPRNIPAGTTGIFGRPAANVPDPNNARFYPDAGLGSTVVFDPARNQDVTLLDFNTDNPLAGDAFEENALGLVIRNTRWMIQEIGVDGFRFDAARHFSREVLEYLDHGIYLASKRTHLDGSPDHAFSFSETGGDSSDDFIAGFIRKDIDNNNPGQLGGNRDSLDFNLFFDIRANLSGNGAANDWRNIKNSSVDRVDDGFANNGSQGVAFAQSHDDGPAHLNNVANAYLALRPGQWNVYLNADEFDNEFRDFPKPGREDALGGLYGDAMTTLVGIRNSHGRGNYLDRTPTSDEKELLIYEREKSALVVLSNRLDGGFDSRTVQTSFAPGTYLIELTGNAASSVVDPFNDFPELLEVNADGTVDLRAPRNVAPGGGGVEHGNGYLIYGVAAPQGLMRLTDAAGADLAAALSGSTPVAGEGGDDGPSDNFLNGTTRLTDITIVQDTQFKIRVETNAVNLLGTFRDRHADGDFAQFRIDEGRGKDGAPLDANGNGFIDNASPGDVDYAFEDFTETVSPGFFDPTGAGVYEQTIDATNLAEGRHYLTGRVYRHRNPDTFTDGDESTRGDGGPAVFTEFRQVIYVDLLPPEAEVVAFEPFASDPANPDNRDLIVRSVDKTADNMHFLFDAPAGLTDAEALALALGGQGAASGYDRDSFIGGFFGVTSGNHAVTVVTFEPTFDGTRGFNVQRFAGLSTTTTIGAGIGDLDADGVFEVGDLFGVNGFEQVLYGDNQEFNAAADANADGLVDNRDLFALGDFLLAGGASEAVLDEYEATLDRRGDFDNSGDTDADDLLAIYAALGAGGGQVDVDANGVVELADAERFVTGLLRTEPGDFNLDGVVDAADYTVWRDAVASGSLLADHNFDGQVTGLDYLVWRGAFGFRRVPFSQTPSPGLLKAGVPEPVAGVLLAPALVLFLLPASRRRRPAPRRG